MGVGELRPRGVVAGAFDSRHVIPAASDPRGLVLSSIDAHHRPSVSSILTKFLVSHSIFFFFPANQ